MIVFIGDWVKLANGKWKQVCTVNVGNDTFATLNIDGDLEWWDTVDNIEDSEDFLDHKSDNYMQDLLRYLGI